MQHNQNVSKTGWLLAAQTLGAIHKRRAQSGGCLVRTFFGKGEGFLYAESALFGAKNFRFFEIYGVFARTRRGGD